MKDSTPVPYTPTRWICKFGAVYADQGKAENDTRILLADRMEPETSPAERDSNLKLSAHAANSYAKHCGPNAIQCAEDDLLGLALDALRSMVGLYAPNALRGGDWMYSGNSRTDAVTRQVRDVFARIPK